MDALGFFALGGALPSAMTGNTALLGLALGQGHPAAAAPPFAAGLGFVLGAALAAAMLHLGLNKLPVRRGVAWLLAAESCLLAGLLLAWQFTDRSAGGLPLYVLILLGAAGMGVQSVAARQDNRPGVTTVVFTSTLTSIVIALTGAILGSPHRLGFAAKRQMFMFLAYGIGAVDGWLSDLARHRRDPLPAAGRRLAGARPASGGIVQDRRRLTAGRGGPIPIRSRPIARSRRRLLWPMATFFPRAA